MAKYQMSKWFARGSGYAVRYTNSDVILFRWNGHEDGAARFVEHVKRYVRKGIEHKSLAALLRSVESEHVTP